MRVPSPTNSFALELPADIQTEVDGRTSSYWRPGEETVLQVSSYSREIGDKTTAEERLLARIDRAELVGAERISIPMPSCSDVSAARHLDGQGFNWLYIYATWPKLTVFFTVAFPKGSELSAQWATTAIGSVQLTASD